MRQDFSGVSAETLAKLFPISLEPHDASWESHYLLEKDFLQSILGDQMMRLHHIGSSAVPGLIAKPIVDILLEIAPDVDLAALTEKLRDNGYIVNTPQKDVIMYLRGYTPLGFEGQAVHIHVRYSGDWDELYFRDYLILHPDIANEYGALKRMLKERYTNDRDGYTEAKGEFVRKYTASARTEFPDRYNPVG